MMDPRHIHIADYDYPLPPERIAKYPVKVRDESKLLVYNKRNISEHHFYDIANFLPADSLLVYNNTRVIQARLRFHKPTGAKIEIFCLEPYEPREYQQNFDSRGQCRWVCLIGNKKKWNGEPLTMLIGDGDTKNPPITFTAQLEQSIDNHNVILFRWDRANLSFAEVLEKVGELPIPPYLNRATEQSDLQTYQTVYSKIDGSVAAPTAGLHFTDRVFQSIDAKNIEREEVTLHVGAGTFRPVKSEEIGDHDMHSEYFFVTRHFIERLLAHHGHCTAVGTTTVRTLESLYWIGVKILGNPNLQEEELHIPQWLPYQTGQTDPKIGAEEALEAILQWMDRQQTNALHTTTQIIIAPGYKYRIVERMITNFHMPKSTLLLLVSAFIGNAWRRVYRFALDHDFRFLSYGDSSLLIP